MAPSPMLVVYQVVVYQGPEMCGSTPNVFNIERTFPTQKPQGFPIFELEVFLPAIGRR